MSLSEQRRANRSCLPGEVIKHGDVVGSLAEVVYDSGSGARI